jgi:Transposase
MKGKRHSPEQIVRKLREADRPLAEGADVDAVCRHLEISVQTYQRWRAQRRMAVGFGESRRVSNGPIRIDRRAGWC